MDRFVNMDVEGQKSDLTVVLFIERVSRDGGKPTKEISYLTLRIESLAVP